MSTSILRPLLTNFHWHVVLPGGSDTRDIATHIITVHDDANLNQWTLRSFIIGIGLSAFGGVLAEIYYFKAQIVLVSTMFLAIISYVIGIAMETFIPGPTWGWFHYLNPARNSP
ncbi:unnamed protein product [Cyclocybe aegerita]|uniref:Uncharacterized protein n=1 Tax=Cyclocybe aegerita TaxID=1973307 RepID=A0A8S0WP08_CYCAE|nr:unnamed protein product [Cyclocybe aegerita]